MTQGDYTYTVSASKATIIGFDASYSGELSIASTLGGYPVTSIGNNVFYGCTGLTSVTISPGITSVGDYAFNECTGLTSVTIPSSVTSIGISAFQGCTGLTSVTIPSGVISIGIGAFSESSGLTNITADVANGYYSSVGGVLFNKKQTTLVQFPVGRTGSYEIPSGVTTIGLYGFYRCTGLTSVMIPSGVTTIGTYGFYGCTGLTSVTIPSSVTTIGADAFYGCTCLIGAFFKGNAPKLAGYVFASSPATVYYLPGTTGWAKTSGSRPTLLWNPQVLQDAHFGVQDTLFGFNISGTTNIPVKVEATTSLVSGVWSPVTNATLNSSGIFSFADPASASLNTRFYRIVFP